MPILTSKEPIRNLDKINEINFLFKKIKLP